MLCTVVALCASSAPVELHILPHTHADVGWLQTVNSLARLNVSRILDGVVEELWARPRRRFVWDEMAFLQLWWDAPSTTAAQRSRFTQLIRDGRVEFVDNGWSQHDMGCTTLDSMVNNWVEGHQWIVAHIGSEHVPRVGWSLDPFGPSASQAVLQALQGFDAWFFTRISGDEVEARKKARALEFVWRASSSLLANVSEIFAHVFESYYCMPHEYQFEWFGEFVPNASTIVSTSRRLANITLNRSEWFRTENVLIPWGCDYMYQDAPLTYNSTDWIIDTINAHAAEWGVRARYSTASEYVDAVRASASRVCRRRGRRPLGARPRRPRRLPRRAPPHRRRRPRGARDDARRQQARGRAAPPAADARRGRRSSGGDRHGVGRRRSGCG